jgi:hypothetical protein
MPVPSKALGLCSRSTPPGDDSGWARARLPDLAGVIGLVLSVNRARVWRLDVAHFDEVNWGNLAWQECSPPTLFLLQACGTLRCIMPLGLRAFTVVWVLFKGVG